MIHNILGRRIAPLVISFAAAISLSAHAQVLNAALSGPIPAILVQPQPDTALPKQTTGIPVKLLRAPAQETRQTLDAPAQSPQRSPESGQPKPKTMLSISSYEQGHNRAPRSLLIRCRTNGSISNALIAPRIVIKGVVTEDVVASGKILIAAGSKVAGIAQFDPDSGRVESNGNWSIIADFREVRVHAELQDADTGFRGIQGKETSFDTERSQRQAVVLDGRYCFVADKTPFILSITGKVIITVLQPLESSE
jgi:hypothetical protein